MMDLITLTTDFGLVDGFVGVMKGVMLSINPDARFVDITHDIAPQNIQQGAFLLANSVLYFPAAAVHLCVVDPGVGSTRRAIAVRVGATTLVGPDNGVLSLAARALEAKNGAAPQAYELTNPRYWLERVSNTFHGRDIFSPCAAHLSRGVDPADMGEQITDWIALAPPAPERRAGGSLVGRVIHIDRYGNIVSNIDAEMLGGLDASQIEAKIRGRTLRGLVKTYSDVEPGELALLIGSPWKLEIARRNGSAAEALGAAIGDEIIVQSEM